MLTPSELNNLSFNELVKELNRQAERINKQVTRAKKRGDWAQATAQNPYAGRLKLITPARAAKIKENYGGAAAAGLIKSYYEREKMSAGGYTKANLAKQQKKLERISKAMGVSKAGAAAIAPRIERASETVAVRRQIYYEVLKVGVQLGIYNSFADVDKPNIPSDKFKWYMQREINKLRRYGKTYGEGNIIPKYAELYDRISTDRAEEKAIVQMLI